MLTGLAAGLHKVNAMPYTKERRRFTRFRFSSMVRVFTGEVELDCNLLDLSLRGFLIQCPSNWHPKAHTSFKLEWHIADVIKLEMNAEVIRIKDNYLGCEWKAHDAESYAHLTRLVEINLLDKKLMERELKALKADTGSSPFGDDK